MYGHHPRLPIDIEFGVIQTNISGPSHENYAQKLKARLMWAYKDAKEEMSSKESKRHQIILSSQILLHGLSSR